MNYTKWIWLASFVSIFLFVQCTPDASKQNSKKDNMEAKVIRDTHTYAKPDEVASKHLSLDLTADFDKKILHGFAEHTLDRKTGNLFVLDIRGLEIEKVEDPETQKQLVFVVGDEKGVAGAPLSVTLQDNTKKVRVHYRTKLGAAAIDWLEPIQTADKKHPFLFTQGQAILTRTWIPVQDSPGIRISYDAIIRTPKELMAVMSAENPQSKNDEGVYSFKMRQPIPPYLIALAIGDLVFESVGPRTGVYSEPSVIKSATYEFGDMEKMLVEAEKLYGPYLWDRYDLIVLPPSFPFGGMENPRLTFATPTVIAGDRSLTSLIAHELAHSWSGNLVTNATWDDFWLNEGFTVYFERRIMEALYGKDYTNMLAKLGRQDLESTIASLDKRDTHLHLDLEGRDPDDGMTDIAYEKGSLFLTTIEKSIGREKLDAFLTEYFETHKFQSMTTDRFVTYLKEKVIEPYNVDIDLDAWIYGPGIPAGASEVSSEAFTLVDKDVANVITPDFDLSKLNTQNWSTHEWLHFIRQLPTDLPMARMQGLDKAYGLSGSGNSEIKAAWYEVAIRNGYLDQILPEIESFLVSVGRRKFLTPLYKAMKESNRLEVARDIFAKAKPNYHSVSSNTIEALLNS